MAPNHAPTVAWKVSVIIPARDEPYLAKTVEDVLTMALGDVEVIVVLDGCWPGPEVKLPDDPRVTIVHTGEVRGMRSAINAAVRISRGRYLMKLDAHCMLDKGFDETLRAHCPDHTLAVPSRYSLDPKTWQRGRGPVEYLYLTYPYVTDDLFGDGLHGRKWTGPTTGHKGFFEPETQRKDVPIDEIITFQGSCWFTTRDHFERIGGLDESYYNIFQEAQELGFKTWLSGGRVIRNKHTWYAHWHKNNTDQSYGLSKKQKLASQQRSTDFWMNDRWDKATRKIAWLIDKFMPMPGWPEDWKEHVHG